MVPLRALSRLSGLLLLTWWTTLVIEPAYYWLFPARAGAISTETASRENKAGIPKVFADEEFQSFQMTASTTSVVYGSPLSSLPLLLSGLLLMWSPRRLVRFLQGQRPTVQT